MSISKLYRVGAVPVLALGLAAPMLLASGCSDDLTCDDSIVAKVEAFQGAVDALVKVSGDMKASVGVACANIANDLGQTGVPDVSDPTALSDDDVTTACNLAKAGITASINASGSISVQVIGGECHVKADAQISCEASCSVDGSCDPGTVDVRCDPGELSGSCSAECTGSCTVETGSVDCQGGCSGTCNGDCSGACGAGCSGKCDGTCTGQCTGTCDVVAPSATCSGSCKGGCSVEYTAPKCEGELKPPSCDIDAECKGGCNAQGNLEAECTEPQIIIEGNADLKATLEANLPAIFLVFKVQGALVLDSAAYVAQTAGGVAEAAVGVPACVAKFAGDLVAQFSGAVSASASVSVSVSASADVGGSTGG